MKSYHAITVLIAFVLAVPGFVLPGASMATTMDNIIVDSRSVLFDAGQVSPTMDGILPVFVDVSSIPGGVVKFNSVTGILKAGYGWPEAGPDGGTVFDTVEGTNVFSANGVSGIIHNRFLFLAGVFTTAAGPDPSNTPDRLDFQVIGSGFTELFPDLNQSFFIGDGRTGIGSGPAQNFHVPASATSLYLGFIDAGAFGWPNGRDPGAYSDNEGSLNVSLDLHAAPVPAAVWLLGSGLLGLFGLRRKFRN